MSKRLFNKLIKHRLLKHLLTSLSNRYGLRNFRINTCTIHHSFLIGSYPIVTILKIVLRIELCRLFSIMNGDSKDS